MNHEIRLLMAIALTAGALVSSAGCELLSTIDRSKIPEADAGANGGTGGTSTTYGGDGVQTFALLLEEAEAAGRGVTLHVLRGSPAARLYARLGFVRTDAGEVHEAMEWRPAARS